MGSIYLFVLNGRGSDEAELAAKLRGDPVFDVFDRRPDTYGLRTRRSKAVDGAQETMIAVPSTARIDQVALVDLDLIVDRPESWADLNARALTIVDVHFPLGSLRNIQAIQPGRNEKTRDLAKDAQTQDRWDDPERLARASMILATAAAVVSPRRAWAKLLEEWSTVERDGHTLPFSVEVLPDVASAAGGGVFAVRLMEIIESAIWIKYRGQVSPWKRSIIPILSIRARMLRRGVKREMTKDLADVDFSYAEVK